MSIIIGLTGPTGSGKSTASKQFEAFGFKVVDCDYLARIAVEKGTAGLKALVETFGNKILNSDKSLNRKALAEIAFKTKENTELLNKTLLPHIAKLVLAECEKSDKVLLDAPTLFESGLNSVCTATVAVLADTDIRLKRITARDGIDDSAALLRISAGKTDDFYKQNADYCLYNNGEQNEFLTEMKKLINNLSF